MQPLSQAVLLEAFPPQDRGKAMGFWGLGIVVAPILGPVLGGWLTDNYSWRWVFYINIPVGVPRSLMTRAFVFDPSYIKRSAEKIDYWGIGTAGRGCRRDPSGARQGTTSRLVRLGVDRRQTIVGVVALVAFVIRELRQPHPVVDLRVFKQSTFAMGVLLTAVLGFVLYGSLVLLPIMLQTLMGYPPIQAGHGDGASRPRVVLLPCPWSALRPTVSIRASLSASGWSSAAERFLVRLAQFAGGLLGLVLAAVFRVPRSGCCSYRSRR